MKKNIIILRGYQSEKSYFFLITDPFKKAKGQFILEKNAVNAQNFYTVSGDS